MEEEDLLESVVVALVVYFLWKRKKRRKKRKRRRRRVFSILHSVLLLEVVLFHFQSTYHSHTFHNFVHDLNYDRYSMGMQRC